MKLIVQPRDGLSSITTAIRLAKKEIAIVIFRFDRPEIEQALETAIKHGVKVHALIAHTNHGGEKRLRRLEQRLLDVGATVARTGDDLVRYHGKFMVIDRSTLWLLGFNFTALDALRSRSFGIVTRRRSEVQQALKLFEADSSRQQYEPGDSLLVVSPERARDVLTVFIRKARRQLLIYDPKVGDSAVIKLLKERMQSGVDVRIIGKVAKGAQDVPHERYPGKRLHVRAIIRDGRDAFVGSQSLRKLELDKRRELGIVVRETRIVSELANTFDEDWSLTDSGKRQKADFERRQKTTGAKQDSRQESAANAVGA